MVSLLYSHPIIYETCMRVMHRKALDERFKVIASEVGRWKKVLDVGCGTGILAKYLDSSCRYLGIDLNQRFVDYGQKKGLDICRGDVFDESVYLRNDVSVLCNILHHVVPRQKNLVDLCKQHAKTVIVCEPFREDRLIKKITDIFSTNGWCQKLFGDDDGINSFKDMIHWIHYDFDDVKKLYKELGVKRYRVVRNNLLGII
jgi:SAM-dependent methyltransferase